MFYVVLAISYGLSLPMPDMATCEDAAFFLRYNYNYHRRPICTPIHKNMTHDSVWVDLRQSKPIAPTKDDTCRVCIKRGWSVNSGQ
jgi:hypothetical protein